MRKNNSVFCFAIIALLTVVSTTAAIPVCQAQTNPSQATNADLASRVAELEKQLADLKAQMEAQKSASAKQTRPGPASIAEVAATTMPTLPSATLAAATPLLQDSAPAAAPAPAPEKPSLAGLLGPTTLSGFIDVYYDYNSNQPASRSSIYRNFDINSSQFALNMIELVADKPVDTTNHLGYHVALGFGQAMNAVNSASPTELGFDQYLKEGYLEYLAPVGKGLQVNVGKFVTPAGAEVIETKDNWNYSRSILFAWAIPYFHFGMSAKYAFNSKFALTGYLMNGWNNSIDNNSGKTTGFTAAWTPSSKFSLIQNYIVGPEQLNDNSDFRHLYDAIMTYSPTSKLSLMANYDWGQDHPAGVSAHWSGIAGYLKYAPADKYNFVVRGEIFNDHDGAATGTAQNLSEITFTAQRMLASKLISRLEFRRDWSDHAVFPYRSALPNTKDQNTVTVGLVYAFSSADAK